MVGLRTGTGTATEIYVDGTPTNGANPWIDSLVWGGAWADAPNLPTTGGPVTISYATVSGTDPYGAFSGSSMTWSAAGLAALDSAMASWEAVANVDFVLADPNNADVWIWTGTDAQAGGALGWSDIPSYSYGEPLYVVFNGQDSSWSTAGLAVGGYGYVTPVHELGHLLGLAHPHDGGTANDATKFPGVTGPGSFGTYNLNQGIYTVMTYNDGWPKQFPNHSAMGYGWEATPMALDIAAIQAIYGANTSYHTGGDTYLLPSVNAQGTYWSCIWDAGGTDTISNAGSSTACVINLNAAPLTGPNAGGYVSWDSGIVGGFTIANGVIIENATGGNGNDTLTGNIWDNILDGRLGKDTLIGAAGNDTYIVDNTGDVVTESANAGTDTVSTTLASYSLSNLINVENLIYTGTAAFTGTGNALANMITGSTGNDILDGAGGKDTINGGVGKDTIKGGAGQDLLIGGADSDKFVFSAISDIGTGASKDTISDFIHLTDIIDLSAIDANTKVSGNQAFTYTTGAFTGVAGQLHFVNGVVSGDVNGDKVADFEINLPGVVTLTALDFVL